MLERSHERRISSLNENDAYTLTTLPEGRQAVGGKWVYTIKESANGSKSYKARYVAKGYIAKEKDKFTVKLLHLLQIWYLSAFSCNLLHNMI